MDVVSRFTFVKDPNQKPFNKNNLKKPETGKLSQLCCAQNYTPGVISAKFYTIPMYAAPQQDGRFNSASARRKSESLRNRKAAPSAVMKEEEDMGNLVSGKTIYTGHSNQKFWNYKGDYKLDESTAVTLEAYLFTRA